MMQKRLITALSILFLSTVAFAQQKKAGMQEKALVMQGNKLYSAQKYKEAQAAYQQAWQLNPAFVPGAFNLGNTLILQKQYDAARKLMTATARNSREKAEQSSANYNIGNTWMSEQKWSEAADAYKEALRRNPQDEDAKYNLSYALAKMKQEQKDKDKNKNQKKDNKDDKQDKNKQDKKDGKDQQDPNKKGDQQKEPEQNEEGEKEGQEKQGNRPQPQPSKLSEQQAENLLKALQQEERKLQDKKNEGKGVPVKLEKDW